MREWCIVLWPGKGWMLDEDYNIYLIPILKKKSLYLKNGDQRSSLTLDSLDSIDYEYNNNEIEKKEEKYSGPFYLSIFIVSFLVKIIMTEIYLSLLAIQSSRSHWLHCKSQCSLRETKLPILYYTSLPEINNIRKTTDINITDSIIITYTKWKINS